MTQKEDAIILALKERVSQLERDLVDSNERLVYARSSKEDTEEKMKLLRQNSHTVVGQWEKVANDARVRLEVFDGQLKEKDAALKEKDIVQHALETKLFSVEAKLAESTDANSTMCSELLELRNRNLFLGNQICQHEASIADMTQRIRDYEVLTSKMKAEIEDNISGKAQDAQALENLGVLHARQADQITTLKCDNSRLCTQVDSLSAEVSELKSGHEKHAERADALQARCNLLESDLAESNVRIQTKDSKIVELIADAESKQLQLLEHKNRTETLEQQQEENAKLLTDLRRVVKELEGDVAELQDAEVKQTNVINELIHNNEFLKEANAELVSQKGDVETEFSAIKECYSALLIELNDHKLANSKTQVDLCNKIDSVTADANQRLTLSEQEIASARSTISQLRSSVYELQIELFFENEARTRSAVESEQHFGATTLAHSLRKLWVTHFLFTQSSLCEAKTSATQMADQCDRLKSDLSALDASQKELMVSIREQHKTASSLEASLIDAQSACQKLDTEKTSLERDNMFLKEQVEAMRQELNELDEVLNANLNEMREESERQLMEMTLLQSQLTAAKDQEAAQDCKIVNMERHTSSLEDELVAQSKALKLSEAEILSNKEKIDALSMSLFNATSQLQSSRHQIDSLVKDQSAASEEGLLLREQMRKLEAKHLLVVSDKNQEIERLRLKLNGYVEKCEGYEERLNQLTQNRDTAEESATALRENSQKMKSAIDELKQRCTRDAESIRDLISDRDELSKERDLIVEKYNRLHDLFRAARKEAEKTTANELQAVVALCSSQEEELQSLRRENSTLKRSMSSFISRSQKEDSIFVEKLNLAEGPLRHPKKRSVRSE